MHRYVVLLILSFFSWQMTLAQAAAPAQQSATYEDEYALYQKANGETNAVQKKALIMEFVKKYSKSDLDTHISGPVRSVLQ